MDPLSRHSRQTTGQVAPPNPIAIHCDKGLVATEPFCVGFFDDKRAGVNCDSVCAIAETRGFNDTLISGGPGLSRPLRTNWERALPPVAQKYAWYSECEGTGEDRKPAASERETEYPVEFT